MDRSAIINLSSEGYGIVRKVGENAVSFEVCGERVVMSNECFSAFLNTLDLPVCL